MGKREKMLVVFDDRKLSRIEGDALHVDGLADAIRLIANSVADADKDAANALYSIQDAIRDAAVRINESLEEGLYGVIEESDRVAAGVDLAKGYGTLFKVAQVQVTKA